MVRPTAGRARELMARVRNALVAPAFARRVAADGGQLPTGGVAVYFATDPANLYQFEQWRRPLEELAQQIGVFVLVDRPDTGAAVQARSSLPVAFARSSAALEQLVGTRDVRVVLYLNQVEANFRMLRFTAPVHVQIGHGESDKDGSLSHQHQAYDVTFVAGRAGRDRLQNLRLYDVEARTRMVGRPQLDYEYPGAPPWRTADGMRILYAPTWEGDRPSIAYGSLASHGVGLIKGLLARDVRIVYRPHPRTGTASREHLAADREIRRLLAGDRHLVDQGEYGWQWGFADACVTDVSAVAYDWLATGKPLLVTEPAAGAYRPASPLLAALSLLEPAAAGDAYPQLTMAAPDLQELQQYYFGEVAERASTQRFQTAVLALATRG